MNILRAINREKKSAENKIATLTKQVAALELAAEALNGTGRVQRHRAAKRSKRTMDAATKAKIGRAMRAAWKARRAGK
jgi:hypothetical protein